MKPVPFSIVSAALLAGLASCSKKESVALAPETAPAAPQMAVTYAPEGGRWDAASGMLRHLEFGGRSFSYESHGSTNSMIGSILKVVDQILEDGAPPAERIRFSPAWEKLGWSRVIGSGSSCRKLGKFWHHRGILFAPGEKPAFFPIFGAEAKPWLAPTVAPEDSDMVLEFALDVPHAMKMIGELAGAIGPKALQVWEEQLGTLKGDPMGEPLLDACKGHFSIFLRLDPTQPVKLPEPIGKFPGVRGGLVVESPEFAAFAAKMLKEDGAPPSEERADGSILVGQPAPAGQDATMPGPGFNPCGVVNTKQGLVLVADSMDTLASMEAKDKKLAASKEFTEASNNLPGEGNAMLFISSRLQKEVGEVAVRFARQYSEGQEPDTKKVSTFLEDMLAKVILSQAEPQMAVLKADADGWVWGANTSFEQLPVYGPAVPIAMMSSVGFSAFQKARGTANLTQAMFAGKQLHLAAMGYAADHDDRFPASLADLVPGYLADMDSVAVKLPGVPPGQHWTFLTEGRNATSNGNLPLFVLNGDIDGRQVVITVSGAALTMTVDEVRALLEGQR